MPLVIVGHGAGAAFLHGQSRLGAIQRLDLALLVDRQDHGMGRRVDVSPTMSRTFAANCGSLESLKVRMRCG